MNSLMSWIRGPEFGFQALSSYGVKCLLHKANQS